MFLNKRTVRPVEKGTFCMIPEDLKKELKSTKSYLRVGNVHGQSYHKDIHVADADVLYVIDEKVFDKEGLYRVIPVSFNGNDYWGEKVDMCSKKAQSFTIEKSKLTIIVGGIAERESIRSINGNRLGMLMSQYNKSFDLHNKQIPLSWDGN